MQLDREGDDQHDEQHQHHVDQRRGVDVDHHSRSPPSSGPRFIATVLHSSSRRRRLIRSPAVRRRSSPSRSRRAAQASTTRTNSSLASSRSPRTCTSGCGEGRRPAPSRGEQRLAAVRARVPVDAAGGIDRELDVLGPRLRGSLVSFGSLSGTDWRTTGIVMRKMMSITSITSTSGVVLMLATTSSSPSPASTNIHRHGFKPASERGAGASAAAAGRAVGADERPPARRHQHDSRSPANSRSVSKTPCCGAQARCSRTPPAPRPTGRAPS